MLAERRSASRLCEGRKDSPAWRTAVCNSSPFFKGSFEYGLTISSDFCVVGSQLLDAGILTASYTTSILDVFTPVARN